MVKDGFAGEGEGEGWLRTGGAGDGEGAKVGDVRMLGEEGREEEVEEEEEIPDMEDEDDDEEAIIRDPKAKSTTTYVSFHHYLCLTPLLDRSKAFSVTATLCVLLN